jgi:hypothetical protein
MATAREWLGKHAAAAVDMHATIEELLETVFSADLCQGVI